MVHFIIIVRCEDYYRDLLIFFIYHCCCVVESHWIINQGVFKKTNFDDENVKNCTVGTSDCCRQR